MKRITFFFLAVFLLALSVSAQQTAPPKELLLFQKLDATVQSESRNFDGVLGVYLLDLAANHEISVNADETFPTASIIKIAILAELFHQAQQGKLNLNDPYTLQSSDLVGGSGISQALTPGATKLTLRDVAALMISVSDNSMTNVLINRLGMDNVNALLDSLGLTHTRLRRKMMDLKAAAEGRENVATPREIALLLEALYKGKVLNKQFTEDFFNLLAVHKESYIPRYLPEDLRVANKPGELEGVRNDCGLVFTGKRPYILCAMSTYVRREQDAGDAIARISLTAYQLFDRLDRSSSLGRVVSSHDSSPP
ncbi:MAG: metallo-hydrolase family protein [Acidobacteria bacterium]|nr:metallo-hydrolase family protein [Acidobacteriota bacterium]